MKRIHRCHHWSLLLFALLALSSVVLGNIPAWAQSGRASAAVLPAVTVTDVGEQIEVAVSIDVSAVAEPDHRLGSFTASLNWDPAVLAYHGDSGILAGFTGMVNTAQVSSGHIVFNGANPGGATGELVVIRITFAVVRAGHSDLDLEFTAMAAAYTFRSLLPILTVNDGQVEVSPEQYTLTVNILGDGSVTLNPEGGTYEKGTVVQLTATPASGWQFSGWVGDLNGDTNPTSITIDGHKTITAVFTQEEGDDPSGLVFLPFITKGLSPTSDKGGDESPLSWASWLNPVQHYPALP